MDLHSIWKNVLAHEGEIFHTLTGLEFTYQMVGNALFIYRDGRKINRSIRQKDFERALNYHETDTKDFYHSVNAPCYVKALLQDARIKGKEEK